MRAASEAGVLVLVLRGRGRGRGRGLPLPTRPGPSRVGLSEPSQRRERRPLSEILLGEVDAESMSLGSPSSSCHRLAMAAASTCATSTRPSGRPYHTSSGAISGGSVLGAATAA
jgi:hypothetical protein